MRRYARRSTVAAFAPAGRYPVSTWRPARAKQLADDRLRLFRTNGSDGVTLDPAASLGAEVLHACQAAAVRASGQHLCFVHRADLDDRRLTTLADAIAREPEAGLGDAAFGWRLFEQLGVMGYRPRDLDASSPMPGA